MSDPSQNSNFNDNENDDDDDDNNNEGMMTLRSRDGVTFQLTAETANLSNMVKDVVDDGADDGSTAAVDILRVDAATLGYMWLNS